MHTMRWNRIAATMLVAGACVPLYAQAEHPATKQGTAQARERGMPLYFRTASDVLGSSIQNSSGDEIGSIEDLIVDRGSGRIEFAIVKTGDFFGLGGKEVAIDYDRFRFSSESDGFELPATEEQLKSYEEFDEDHWLKLESGETWQERLDGWSDGASAWFDRWTGDEYADGYDANARQAIAGEIVSVERVNTGDGRTTTTVATIETKDGERKQVVLGPSWYVQGGQTPVLRGQRAELEVTPATRTDQRARLIAMGGTIDGRDVEFRGTNGNTAWRPLQDSADTEDSRTAPWLLLSDVIGRDAVAGREDAGSISGAVVEAASGTVPILLLDPDENFLGIADTQRCVPWSQVSLSGNGKAYLDASKEMLTAGEAAPEDVSAFKYRAVRAPVYEAFGVSVWEPKERYDERDARSPQTRSRTPSGG